MRPKDPTADNPPKYFVVQEWDSSPDNEVRNQSTSWTRWWSGPPTYLSVAFPVWYSDQNLLAALEGSAEILQQQVLDAIKRIDTVEQAREVLIDAAETKTKDPGQVVKAITFLEKKHRKEAKDLDAADGASQLLKDIDGAWNLIFTTGMS